jgi:molecular chaperone GrpE
MTPEAADAVLADFRTWLTTAPAERPDDRLDPVDVAAHFTALRHEVNLLTKTTRVAVEQNAETLAALQKPPAPPEDKTLPLVKAVIDIADSLAVALRQIDRSRETLRELLAPPEQPPPRGLFARLLTAPPAPPPNVAEKLAPLADGLADGYAMSLRRVDRVLPLFGLEAIDCVGKPFDPEVMEAVEMVDGPVGGAVVEEVRKGYRRGATVYRASLVKVAR